MSSWLEKNITFEDLGFDCEIKECIFKENLLIVEMKSEEDSVFVFLQFPPNAPFRPPLIWIDNDELMYPFSRGRLVFHDWVPTKTLNTLLTNIFCCWTEALQSQSLKTA